MPNIWAIHLPLLYFALLRLPASLLPITFTGQGLLDPEFLARLQIEGVPFDFADDVLLNNLPLEPTERVLHRLAVLKHYLSQAAPPSAPIFPLASWSHFRRRSRFDLRQLFR